MRSLSFILAFAFVLAGSSLAGSLDAGLPKSSLPKSSLPKSSLPGVGTFSYTGSPVHSAAPRVLLAAR